MVGSSRISPGADRHPDVEGSLHCPRTDNAPATLRFPPDAFRTVDNLRIRHHRSGEGRPTNPSCPHRSREHEEAAAAAYDAHGRLHGVGAIRLRTGRARACEVTCPPASPEY